jgi:hypothetical protein
MPFRRNAVIAKKRDDGKLMQSPSAHRDWDQRHTNHNCEQDCRIGDRQDEARRD